MHNSNQTATHTQTKLQILTSMCDISLDIIH